MLIFQYNRERQFKVEELNIRLQTINAEILNDIEEGGNPSEIRNSVSDVHRLRVSIIDSTGRVISDNTLTGCRKEPPQPRGDSQSHEDGERIRHPTPQ